MAIFNNNSKFLLGHRGDPKNFEENTLNSFRGCVDKGADGFETDVYLTKDKILVISHDETLKSGLKITHSTYDEIHKADPSIPALLETLEHFPNSLIDIEVKPCENTLLQSITSEIADCLFETIQNFNVNDLLITSFSMEQLSEIKSRMPTELKDRLTLGYLFYPDNFQASKEVLDQTRKAGESCDDMGLDFFLPHFFTLTEDFLNLSSTYDYGLIAWTVNEPTTAVKLLKYDQIQGIISDYPKLVAINEL